MVALTSSIIELVNEPRGASPLTMCISLLWILGASGGWVGYWGVSGGWVDWKKGGMLRRLQIHRDVNPPQATNPSNTAEDGPVALAHHNR
jgi:hypothetical protein